MAVKKIRNATNKARRVGKELNKYSKLLQMVPYANQAITGANLAVQAADSFADMMEMFSATPLVGGPANAVAPVANSVQIRRTKPKFRNTKGIVRIMHKELVTSINASTVVATTPRVNGVSAYQVNAGCGSAFPWLAQIATNYDFYRFKRVRLVYVPMCPTTQDGRVMLGYDVDSTDLLPLDRQAMSSYSCSTEGSAWAVQSLDCALADNSKWFYTDSAGVGTVSGAHNALLDQGQFFAATYGSSGAAQLGEVYVLYDVEFKDPQPSAANVVQTFGTGSTTIQFLPSNFPAFNATGSATSIVFTFTAPGRYIVTMTGAATAISNPTSTAGGTIISSNSLTSGTGSNSMIIYSVDTPTTTLTIPGLTALGNWTVYISRLPYYLTGIF